MFPAPPVLPEAAPFRCCYYSVECSLTNTTNRLAGKTVLAIARTDGDCTCGMARVGPEQQPECGIYRYYYQAYSSDAGHALGFRNWGSGNENLPRS